MQDRVVDDILAEAQALVARLGERQNDVARHCGQTRASAQLLGVVPRGGATVPQLARELGQSRQGVQRVADTLVEKALATYEHNPHHRRSSRLELTDRGEAVRAALQREAASREPDVEQDMEPEELEMALYVLRALRDAL